MTVTAERFLIARGKSLVTDAPLWLRLLRDRDEFQVSISDDCIWVRVDGALTKDAARTLALLPGAEILVQDEQQRLIPVGKSVPIDRLPSGIQWKPISQLTRLWLPHSVNNEDGAGTIAASPQLIPHCLKFSPAMELGTVGALLCKFSHWSSFVLRNIPSKWRHLRFACCKDATGEFKSLVVGDPIPSIPGVRLVESDRILTPIAFRWTPGVPANAVRLALGVPESDWVLWRRESSIEIISDSDFLSTTRVTIRATAKATAIHGNEP